jgi:GTP diphosphokinase / guanosine-3',5'-bis(diphosphate) 3'-diphosphatase
MNLIDLKIRSRDIDTLIKTIHRHSGEIDIDMVRRAYEFAEMAHRKDRRLSGEPYIVHPLEVAIILAQLSLDTSTLCAALLHDVVEDTNVTLDRITSEFSEEISQLVDGVTKISSIKQRSKAMSQAETLRKMLFATIKDVRVIIIKLADKLHNMRTIMFQPEDKQRRIAKETMDIYAPIARRLGMSQMSSELEDLAFSVLYPDEYNDIKQQLAQRKHELEDYIETIRTTLREKLLVNRIDVEITGRAKHFYSIHRKLKEQNKSFDEIYDIRGIRVITREVKDCYAVLGVIHTIWSPVASRFKDYIAVPKSNMYQSLHTTVIGPGGFPLEIQIRTDEMHATAEMGIAAHWIYKDKAPKKDYKNVKLLQDIDEWQSNLKDSKEFMKSLKMDLYEDEIFVFTPKGKIIKLGIGATPIDFAFTIHTEIGNHTVGAKVNNRLVPLKTRLKSGDIIEVLTSKKGHPSESWLKIVSSPNARYKIRNWLKKARDIPEDRDKKEEEHRQQEKTIAVSIPQEEQIKLKSVSKQKGSGVTINGTSNIMIRLSQCCQPIPGDQVVGFITRGRGITVHKHNCPSLKRLQDERERFIKIVWDESSSTLYPVKIELQAMDRVDLLRDIADEISLCKTNIIKMEAQVQEKDSARFKFILEVNSNRHLNEIIQRLKKIRNVTNVFKLNEKVIIK